MIITLAQINLLLICSAMLASRSLSSNLAADAKRRQSLAVSGIGWILAVLHWASPPGGESYPYLALRSGAILVLFAAIVLVVIWIRAYRAHPSAVTPLSRPTRLGNLFVFALVAFVALLGGIFLEQRRLAWIPEPSRRTEFDQGSRQARLLGHVRRLAGDIGERSAGKPDRRAAAAEYIAAKFKEAGYDVVVQSIKFPFGGVITEFQNLSVVLPGEGNDSPVLVVGAHYDSAVGTPGADDNASGIAALLEMARSMKGSSGSVEVHFVAFANEEPPFFGSRDMGSFHYAGMLKDGGRKLIGMISLEMLGYYSDLLDSQAYLPFLSPFVPSRGNFIGIASNFRSLGFLVRLRRAMPGPLRVPVITVAMPAITGVVALSDNLSFWRHGFPAVMVTDTAFLRNRHYHKRSDLPDSLDYDRMTDVVDSLETALRALRR